LTSDGRPGPTAIRIGQDLNGLLMPFRAPGGEERTNATDPQLATLLARRDRLAERFEQRAAEHSGMA
jgi:hypothetical protein